MRWPLEPLAALIGGRPGAMALGFDSGEWSRAQRSGLGDIAADRWAVRAGLHPFVVWPEMADQEDIERRRKDAARKRRNYRRSESARRARIEASAAYRAAHPEYVALSNARYREANRDEINRRERERYQRRKESH